MWGCVNVSVLLCLCVHICQAGRVCFLFSLLFLLSVSHFVLLNIMKYSMQIKLNWLINFIKR